MHPILGHQILCCFSRQQGAGQTVTQVDYRIHATIFEVGDYSLQSS